MPPAPDRFCLLQWNIGNFDVRLHPLGGGPRGMRYSYASASRPEDLEDLAAVIRRENPDIATLQEVVVKSGHHARLAELSGYRLAASGGPEERHTQAILVRPGLEFSPGPEARGFRGVTARIRAGGREVIAASIHSTAGRFTDERAAQHRALAAWVREASRQAPVLAAGDFNFDDDPESMHGWLHGLSRRVPGFPEVACSDWEGDRAGLTALREALQDLGAEAGPTAGAPRLWPRILLPWAAPLIPLAWALGIGRRRSRLDYVWATEAFKLVETRVLPLTGPDRRAGAGAAFPWMDHDPIVARAELKAR